MKKLRHRMIKSLVWGHAVRDKHNRNSTQVSLIPTLGSFHSIYCMPFCYLKTHWTGRRTARNEAVRRIRAASAKRQDLDEVSVSQSGACHTHGVRNDFHAEKLPWIALDHSIQTSFLFELFFNSPKLGKEEISDWLFACFTFYYLVIFLENFLTVAN